MSVDFDPVKVRPKRRRADPVLVGVIAVAVGLSVAVLKPWEAGIRAGSDPEPSIAVVAATSTPTIAAAAATFAPSTPSPSARADARGARQAFGTIDPPPAWQAVERVLHPHDSWGVRVILRYQRGVGDYPPTPPFRELWSAAPVTDGIATVDIERDDQQITALGITVPAGLVPQDVRVWRVHQRDQLEWIDARPFDGASPDGAFLLARRDVSGGIFPWAPGHYRIDVLAGGTITRIAVRIPGGFGSVPEPDEWLPAEANLIDPAASDPSGVGIGSFATVDGIGVPLAATSGPLLGEEEAWTDALGHRPGAAAPAVASAFLPRATGIGAMLPSEALVQRAVVGRLAPDARYVPQVMVGGISGEDGLRYVIVGPRGGGAWPPGVYALTVHWTDPVRLHVETWQVELLPGPPGKPVAVR